MSIRGSEYYAPSRQRCHPVDPGPKQSHPLKQMPHLPSLYTELVHNLAILISMAVIYDLLGLFNSEGSLRRRILAGGLFGLAAVVTLMTPIAIARGLIFDGRTIVILVTNLFAGARRCGGGPRCGEPQILSGRGRQHRGSIGDRLCRRGGSALYHLRRKDPQWVGAPALLTVGIGVQLCVMLL